MNKEKTLTPKSCYISTSPEETLMIAEKFGRTLEAGSVIAFRAPMGAGKTHFTKGIARALGIKEVVTSPTFTIISEYTGQMTLYHMDLYRIDSSEEFEFLGIEHMLYGDGIAIIEWSEKVPESLPDNTIFISISIDDPFTRTITIGNSET